MDESDKRLAAVDLGVLDRLTAELAKAGRNTAQISQEIGVTYWKVRKSLVRQGINPIKGKGRRKRTYRVGDPDYDQELARNRMRDAMKKKDPIERKRQEILEAERRRIEGLPEPPQRVAEPVESIWD